MKPTVSDYILGLCDMTGEAMKVALTDVGKGQLDRIVFIRDSIRELYNSKTKKRHFIHLPRSLLFQKREEFG